MNHESTVLELSAHLALMSLLAVGGGLIMIAPEVRDYVVGDKQWLSNGQFAAAYAIAQAAPGPNLLFISLVGWLVAGWSGAIGATVAVILPSTLLTLGLIKVQARRVNGALWQALQHSFLPISIGLLGATAWIFARISNADWRADMLTVFSAAVILGTRLNPVWLIAAGATAGLAHLI